MNGSALTRLSWTLVVLLFATGCQQKPTSEPPTVTHTPFEQSLMLGDIHGLADGGAYLASYRGIYYVNRGVAKKVAGLPADTFGEIVPLADGSALYLSSFEDPPKLLWLRGASARPVQEGNISAEVELTPTHAGFLFAENQRLEKKLAEVASELSARQDYEEPYYEDDRY